MSVSLEKGQRISLVKETGGALSRATMGLGWDARKSKGFFGLFKQEQEIDLDASCLMFDARKQLVDTVWFRQLSSKDGSIVHTGDNRTGAGDGDDEQIKVDLERVPAFVDSLVFTVNSFTGQDFSQIENAYCRLVDAVNGREIARFNLSVQGSHTAQVMARLYRQDGGWQMQAIGANGNGRTFGELLPLISAQLT